jgi:hypothetical protein
VKRRTHELKSISNGKGQSSKGKWSPETDIEQRRQIKKQRAKMKNAQATQPELSTPGQLTTDNGQLTARLARKMRIFAANGYENQL